MPFARFPFRDCLLLGWALSAAILLAACSTTPAPVSAPAVQPLEQYMREAADAATAGNKDRARELYRTAAKTNPTSKEPWLKLADDYMRDENYGHAILSAQEVLQRDPADVHAAGILTVGGLRLAASGIQSLRQQKGTFNGETRTEAQKAAAVLREVTGEKELVPPPPIAASAEPTASAAKPAPARRPAAAAPPRPPASAPAAKPPDNPFKPSR
jgi:tetratricopeptide (TPR) repeat protein